MGVGVRVWTEGRGIWMSVCGLCKRRREDGRKERGNKEKKEGRKKKRVGTNGGGCDEEAWTFCTFSPPATQIQSSNRTRSHPLRSEGHGGDGGCTIGGGGGCDASASSSSSISRIYLTPA